jgi:2-polyprenyl-3-methyl-5-hydroxy-6-metoxy-1,4-benzoquinol methylase
VFEEVETMHDENLLIEEQSTIDYYNKNIQSYIERTFQVEMEDAQDRFLKHLPPKARILDAGCGPGRDALAFTKKGYSVLGFDAALEMVKYVKEQLHIPAMQGFFQEMEFSEEFEGIWASASLIHVSPSALSDVLHRFWKALTPNGILAFSFKEGVGIKKEGDRIFTYMNKENLFPYVEDFIILDQWNATPKEGVNLTPCTWLNTVVRKKNRMPKL